MTAQHTTEDSTEIARFAQHAKDWWNTSGPLRTLHDINPKRVEWIKQFITPKQLKILDIGCGGGILSEGLAKAGAHVTGLDLEAGALEVARAHAAEEKLDITYVCDTIEDYAENHEAPVFDAITCLEMLEHVPNPALVIASAAKLLKPGGYLFLSTINRTMEAYASVIVAAEYVLSLIPRQTHTYERFIKPSELAKSVRGAGLEVLGVTGLLYHPLTRQAELSEQQVNVNYLMVAKRPL